MRTGRFAVLTGTCLAERVFPRSVTPQIDAAAFLAAEVGVVLSPVIELCICRKPLSGGSLARSVTVAHQVLVLSVKVRILAGQ
jgi:hypothetical protein